MDKDRVLALAKLARVEISDLEAESLSRDFDAILGYVSEIKSVATLDLSQPSSNLEEDKCGVYNVLRDDTNPHESGIYTEKILNEAPDKEDDYIRVKKIL